MIESIATKPTAKMRRRISSDLKMFVHRMWKAGLLSEEDVGRMAFSRATLWRIDRSIRQKGYVGPQRTGSGRYRKLTTLDIQIIADAVRTKPQIYLDELQDLLRDYGVDVSVSTLSRHLARQKLTKRRLQRIALERSDSRIRRFLYRIAAFAPEQLLFIDESSFDIRVTTRLGGWGRRGDSSASIRVPRRWDPRYSLVAGLCVPRDLSEPAIIEPYVLEGSFNTDKFNHWIRGLLRTCEVFPGRGSVVVLDNCPIHRQAARIIENYGCVPVYLPPYSPQFNPIELAFNQIKAAIRRRFNSRYEWATHMSALHVYQACDVVDGHNAKKYFEADGYDWWEVDP